MYKLIKINLNIMFINQILIEVIFPSNFSLSYRDDRLSLVHHCQPRCYYILYIKWRPESSEAQSTL